MIVLPVIHHRDEETTFKNAEVAFSEGCSGLFLISHTGDDSVIPELAARIKRQYPDKMIGINLLTQKAHVALRLSLAMGLDATWVDSPGITSAGPDDTALALFGVTANNPQHLLFASVAFKYQQEEPYPAVAAGHAARLGMIPTTSGSGTGEETPVEKVATMRNAIGDAPLAIASGVTPENALRYVDTVTYCLVATGIGSDFYTIDREKLRLLLSRSASQHLP